MDDRGMNQAMDEGTTAAKTTTQSNGWLELKDPADASRLLNGCPVCFLTTIVSSKSSSDNSCGVDDNDDVKPPKRNVMVISWLTPANRKGRIILSMNRRRHTASTLGSNNANNSNGSKESFFGLSIPTTTQGKEMEELLAHVGSTSGRWGRSKFPCDYDSAAAAANRERGIIRPGPRKSKQARKREKFAFGIPQLRRTALGQEYTNHQEEKLSSNNHDDDDVFAIDGTVAHIRCQVLYKEDETSTMIDKDHYFIVAQIRQAFVKESYWDNDRRVFALQGDSNNENGGCGLTFFGSRRFGCVRPPIIMPRPQLLMNDSGVKTQQQNTASNTKQVAWTVLTEGKQFSRLLYTNPLCLMSSSRIGGEGGDEKYHHMPHTNSNDQRHTVLSQLTATNNAGSFMFCIVRRKLAADILGVGKAAETTHVTNGKKFSLSVPVEGMEGFVQEIMLRGYDTAKAAQDTLSWDTIPLTAGSNGSTNNESVEGSLQCITGCVAYMECQVYGTTSTSCTTKTSRDDNDDDDDDDRVVVFARVERAYVHPSYWNETQQWFVPQNDEEHPHPPPYLKHIGNEVFGHVLPSSS